MRVAGLAENVLELLGAEGMFTFAGRFEAAPAKNEIGRAVEQPDEWKKDPVENDQRRRGIE